MQLRRFYVPELTGSDEVVTLPEGESQHALRVLRLRPGEELLLLDGKGRIARAALLPPPESGRKVRLAQCQIQQINTYPKGEPRLELCVAPPRGKAFDLVLKAATELGFAVIQPVLCHFGVARPEELADNRQETLIAALKQSCNPWLPELRPPLSFSAVLAEGKPGIFGASPAAEATPRQGFGARQAVAVRCVWVGPEGGFAPEEEEALLAAGITPVTLGNATLRVETAVPALAGFLFGVLQQMQQEEAR